MKVSKIKQAHLDKRAMYSQLDIRWYREAIGETNFLIGDYGCTLTSICKMIFNLTKLNITPREAAKIFRYNHRGEIYWHSIPKALDEIGYKIKFEGRFFGRPSHKNLTKYGADPEKGMLLQIYQPQYKYPYHWVLLKNNTILRLPFVSVFDPIPGKIVKKAKWKIVGYALFSI